MYSLPLAAPDPVPAAIDEPSVPPALSLLGLEPVRAALEYASLQFMDRSLLPHGDGHAVVIFPGLAADRRSTAPLHDFCEGLGYTTFDWGRGFNVGPNGDIGEWLAALAADVDALTRAQPQRISLIGWSLGGLYAREVARALPQRVRQVITIGTPLSARAEHTHAGWLYRLAGAGQPDLEAALTRRLRAALPVPTTSIYSRSDGVIAWQACLQRREGPCTENVEVEGSHVGLGWNPEVLRVVADRLAQPVGHWKPMQAPH